MRKKSGFRKLSVPEDDFLGVIGTDSPRCEQLVPEEHNTPTISLTVSAPPAGGADHGVWRLYRLRGGMNRDLLAEFDLSRGTRSSKLVLREGQYLLQSAEDEEEETSVRFQVFGEGARRITLSGGTQGRASLRRVGRVHDYVLTLHCPPSYAVLLVRVTDSNRRALAGASFELESDDGRIQRILTSSDVFSGRVHLVEGQYTLTSEVCAAGYSEQEPVTLEAVQNGDRVQLRLLGGTRPGSVTLAPLPEMENVFLLTLADRAVRDKEIGGTQAQALPVSTGAEVRRLQSGRAPENSVRQPVRSTLSSPVSAVTRTDADRTVLAVQAQEGESCRGQTVLAVQTQEDNTCRRQTVLGVQEADDADGPIKCLRIRYEDFFGAPLSDALFNLSDDRSGCQLIECDRNGISPLICLPLGCYTLTQVQTPCGFIPIQIRFCVVRCAGQRENARIVLEDDYSFARVTHNRCDRAENASLILNARSFDCGCGGM